MGCPGLRCSGRRTLAGCPRTSAQWPWHRPCCTGIEAHTRRGGTVWLEGAFARVSSAACGLLSSFQWGGRVRTATSALALGRARGPHPESVPHRLLGGSWCWCSAAFCSSAGGGGRQPAHQRAWPKWVGVFAAVSKIWFQRPLALGLAALVVIVVGGCAPLRSSPAGSGGGGCGCPGVGTAGQAPAPVLAAGTVARRRRRGKPGAIGEGCSTTAAGGCPLAFASLLVALPTYWLRRWTEDERRPGGRPQWPRCHAVCRPGTVYELPGGLARDGGALGWARNGSFRGRPGVASGGRAVAGGAAADRPGHRESNCRGSEQSRDG